MNFDADFDVDQSGGSATDLFFVIMALTRSEWRPVIAKARIKFAEIIERNDLDDTHANAVRNYIETAEERVLGARLAIAEAKELIANADKLLSQR